MSLNYSLVNVRPDLPVDSAERQEWWDNLDWNNFESLVFNCINLGFQSIKDEADAKEYYLRMIAYYRAIHGTDPYIPYEFVIEFIGLSTNCTKKSRTQFNKWLAEYAMEKAVRAFDLMGR